MTTCVHFIAIPDKESLYSSVALPMVRDYAKRTGASLNLITQRKFPDYPVQYEMMQIFEDGALHEWNLYIGAGTLLGPKLLDPTTYITPDTIATHISFAANDQFFTDGNIYFERDERNIGISDNVILAHNLTHEIWEPLTGPYQNHAARVIDQSPHKICSYALSHNVAKYGLKIAGLFPPQAQFDVLSDERLGGVSVEEYLSKVVRRWRDA